MSGESCVLGEILDWSANLKELFCLRCVEHCGVFIILVPFYQFFKFCSQTSKFLADCGPHLTWRKRCGMHAG